MAVGCCVVFCFCFILVGILLLLELVRGGIFCFLRLTPYLGEVVPDVLLFVTLLLALVTFDSLVD